MKLTGRDVQPQKVKISEETDRLLNSKVDIELLWQIADALPSVIMPANVIGFIIHETINSKR